MIKKLIRIILNFIFKEGRSCNGECFDGGTCLKPDIKKNVTPNK